MTTQPYARVTIKSGPAAGQQINRRTAAMIAAAEKSLGFPLTIVQGSYRAGHGAAASAGTHDKGGVVDFRVWGYPAGKSIDQVVKALRLVGFAAWYRTVQEFPTGAHIHAVAIADRELAASAAAQVVDYKAGRNGLANHGKDTGPKVPIRTWEQIEARSGIKRARPVLWLGGPKGLPGGRRRRYTRKAQRHLGVTPDGIYGEVTRAACRKFRHAHHLGKPLGKVGARVWAKFDELDRLKEHS